MGVREGFGAALQGTAPGFLDLPLTATAAGAAPRGRGGED